MHCFIDTEDPVGTCRVNIGLLQMVDRKMWVAAASVSAVFVAMTMMRPKLHSEEALMSDWSNPPPWPIFIGVNAIAGVLRSAADALTPPPIRMLDHAVAFQTSMLAHICQSSKIPDFLATGPKTIPQLADHVKTKDELRVERIMYAMAADGMTQLDPSMRKGDAPRFVNSALSATLGSSEFSQWHGWSYGPRRL